MDIVLAVVFGFIVGALFVLVSCLHDIATMSWAEWREAKQEFEFYYKKYLKEHTE